MAAATAPRWTDAAGTQHATAEAAARIVSLVPSVTELLCDLGLADRLVGRTGFCIHPRETVAAIAKVGGTKDVRIERIRRLAPTHLVVNVDENEKATVEAISRFVPNVVVTHPLTIDDNRALYRLLGGIFGRSCQAEALVARLDAALARARRVARQPIDVLYLIWKDPWMTVARSTYISSALAAVGLRTCEVDDRRRYPVFEFDAVDWPRVDAVLLSSEPYRFGERAARALEADPLLAGTPCRLIDGEMTSWYGSRAIAGIDYLIDYRAELERVVRQRGERRGALRGAGRVAGSDRSEPREPGSHLAAANDEPVRPENDHESH